MLLSMCAADEKLPLFLRWSVTSLVIMSMPMKRKLNYATSNDDEDTSGASVKTRRQHTGHTETWNLVGQKFTSSECFGYSSNSIFSPSIKHNVPRLDFGLTMKCDSFKLGTNSMTLELDSNEIEAIKKSLSNVAIVQASVRRLRSDHSYDHIDFDDDLLFDFQDRTFFDCFMG